MNKDNKNLPNEKVLASLDEVVADINSPRLQRTSSKEELERLLNS